LVAGTEGSPTKEEKAVTSTLGANQKSGNARGYPVPPLCGRISTKVSPVAVGGRRASRGRGGGGGVGCESGGKKGEEDGGWCGAGCVGGGGDV